MSGVTSFRILNIGLDGGLLDPAGDTESQLRQVAYARDIPAEITHVVRAKMGASRVRVLLDGGRVLVEPVPVRHKALYPFCAARTGARVLRRGQFDLIQVQEPMMCGPAGLYLARRFGLPLVAGAFSDLVANPAWTNVSLIRRVANFVGMFVYARADAIRADSKAVARRLAASGFPQARFVPFLITNAEALAVPAVNAAEVRRNLLGENSGPLLLAVARLEPEKNIALMLRAFSELGRHVPGAVLAVAGEGSLRRQLEESAPGAKVRWLGWIGHSELAAYYQAADLLLLSSDVESSARVLTEALLSGTPVLTTDTAGAREVVEDGGSGRIVPVGDAGAFSAALLDLCRAPRRLEEMGDCGRQAALAFCSREAVVAGLRNIYGHVTRRHARESAPL